MNKQREDFRRNFSGYRSMWLIVTFDPVGDFLAMHGA